MMIERFQEAKSYAEFTEAAREHPEMWRGMYERARVPEEVFERAVDQRFRIAPDQAPVAGVAPFADEIRRIADDRIIEIGDDGVPIGGLIGIVVDGRARLSVHAVAVPHYSRAQDQYRRAF